MHCLAVATYVCLNLSVSMYVLNMCVSVRRWVLSHDWDAFMLGYRAQRIEELIKQKLNG